MYIAFVFSIARKKLIIEHPTVEEEGTNCENLPQTHTFLKKMRKWLDDNYTGRVLLAEACQPPVDVRKYFGDGEGDEFHMGYQELAAAAIQFSSVLSFLVQISLSGNATNLLVDTKRRVHHAPRHLG